MRKHWIQSLALATLIVLLAAPAFGQTIRGQIAGTVTDESGAALPGVTVTLTSPMLQGTQIQTTDEAGRFRFPAVPPGQYKAKFELEGFGTIEREDIRLSIGGERALRVEMTSAFTEELVVTSERAVVDTQSAELGVNLSADFFLELPVSRGVTGIARVAPGVQSDASGITFYGSSGAENAYYIDGVNTTGIELGQEGKTLNFEFIQEVQVKTAGYDAEYGRAIGGTINVITKSGGNEFKGDVFAYYDDVQNSLSGAAAVGPIVGTRQVKEFTRTDAGIDIGGYIVKDKLWFFAAYDRVDNKDVVRVIDDFTVVGGPNIGDTFDDKTERDLWALKLTWSASPSHSFYASAFGDPSERTGPANRSLGATELHFLGTDLTGATDQAYNYDGVITDNFIVNARVSFHEERNELVGPGTDSPGYLDFSNPLGDGTVLWGFPGHEAGFGFYQNQPELTRDQYNADFTFFVDDFLGSHEFKAGYEFEDIGGTNDNFNGGTGQRIYRFNCFQSDTRDCQGSPYYYRHRFYVASPGLEPTTLTLADVLVPLSVNIKTENDAIYVQDTWRPTSNFTVKAGVRFETQQLYNALGTVSGDIDDNLAPRLGLIWDPSKSGRSKLFLHYGRFYETIPMDIVIRSFGAETQFFTYNLSPEPGDVAADLTVRNPSGGRAGISRVDPNVEGEYLDELVIGAEWEVRKSFNIGVKYIQRDLKNVIEDALSADGDYFIGNPGKGLMVGTYDLGYAFGYNETLHQLPIPTREFQGIEVTASKRLTRNFQFLASALWSELKGDYDGSFQVSTGQLDPNLNSAFDYFDFAVNNQGFLSNDREWQLKFDGIYRFDFGLTTGVSLFYRTGTPITAMGYSVAYNNWEYYLSERGAFGRADDAYEADLHLGYPIDLGGGREINLLLDIFNLLDVQTETRRDIRYTVSDEQVEGDLRPDGTVVTVDYKPLDWITGVSNVLLPGDTARPPTSDGFNTANRWTNPRRFRFGVRFSF